MENKYPIKDECKGLRQRCGLKMLSIDYIQVIVKNESLVLVQLEASPTNSEGKKLVYILGHTELLSLSHSPFYFKLRHTCCCYCC